MRTKLLTLALFGMISLSFVACNEEEFAPVNDITVEEAGNDNDNELGEPLEQK